MNLSDILTVTVSQLFALAPGAIAAVVAYALGWFPTLDTRIANGIKIVFTAAALAFVGYVATLLPDSFMALKVIDAAIMILGSLASLVGGTKLGGLKAESHRAQQLDVRATIENYSVRAGIMVFAFLILASALAGAASADGPADYRYAMVKCSGLMVSQLATAQQQFDTQYGFAHQLTTPAQWAGSFEARSNEFAVMLGCNPPLSNGALTFWYRVYEPVYQSILQVAQ